MGSDIDIKIGQKIRKFRTDWHLSQSELAEKIDISFQQVQKYEKGKSTISMRRLLQISRALDVPVSVFFPEEDNDNVTAPESEYGKTFYKSKHQLLVTEEEKKMLQYFRKITNKKIRKGIIKQLQGIHEIEKNK